MKTTRRGFLAATSAAGAAGAANTKAFAANDRIRIALIGAGGMGSSDLASALRCPGVELAAAADVYQGRLDRIKEAYGSHIFTTRDYREVLARKDVDAVIVGTPDHWHARISIDAMNAGKDVYCEKPMVQKVSQGMAVVEAQKRTGRLFQVGSQYVSSLIYHKAQALLKQGAIGRLNMVEAWVDRNTALGAWQYNIPPHLEESEIDWDRFLGDAPKRPFEPIRLFRWRNYQDYGTGVAGDLFVHLFSGLHFATSSIGPTRIYASGGLRRWKDGRDVADVMLALVEYPERPEHPDFTLMLRVNLTNGGNPDGFGFRFTGDEGVMSCGSAVTVSKGAKEIEPGTMAGAFSKKVREDILREYREKYPEVKPSLEAMRPHGEQVFDLPPRSDAHQEHHRTFWNAVRNRTSVVEDSTYGLRAAGPALLCNTSCYEGRMCKWDPVAMKEL